MTDTAALPISMPHTADHAGRPGPRPIHLASWSIGADLEDDPVTELGVDADDATPERLRARIASLRAVDPNRAIAVVHAGRAGPGDDAGAATPDWRRQLAEVVDCLSGRSDGFTGDTTPTSLARLRRWAGDTLRRGAVPTAAASDIVLLIDELASNVEEHAPGWMTVDLEFAEHRVLIVVSDPHPSRMPVPGDPPPERPSGRGLLVVSALSTAWGVVLGRTSKAVWAEVAWPPVQGTAHHVGAAEEPITTG
jgi:anti-sigma regulatory factor (Ser/Thr protein kinase)